MSCKWSRRLFGCLDHHGIENGGINTKGPITGLKAHATPSQAAPSGLKRCTDVVLSPAGEPLQLQVRHWPLVLAGDTAMLRSILSIGFGLRSGSTHAVSVRRRSCMLLGSAREIGRDLQVKAPDNMDGHQVGSTNTSTWPLLIDRAVAL